MSDIIFKTDDYVFSYRVAGIIIHEGKILLQKVDDDGYSFPGGHVSLGETNEETLIREFKEEINVNITVKELKWVGEIFIPWGKKSCHQIGLYYNIELNDYSEIPLEDKFFAKESLMGNNFEIEFHWISLKDIDDVNIYPTNAKKLIKENNEGVYHFVYKE